MRPEILLPVLLGGAIGAAGISQGLHWKAGAAVAGDGSSREQIASLENELELLRRENESLRSLAQGGGELSVPPELISFVETAIGLEFRSSPVVHRVAGEELRQRVTASIESRFPPNTLDHRQAAWSLTGLLTPDDRFAPQLAATRSLGARSWFDDQVGEAWVTDSFDPRSIPDQAALIRALSRILTHQNYPPEPGYPGDDADRARDAIHHGAAITTENRFLARQALGLGFTGTQATSDARDLLASLPVFIRGLATFPASLGTPRAERLMDQEELLGTLYDPPATTAWYYPGLEEVKIPPIKLPDTPGTNVLEESAGLLGLELWLQTLDPELATMAPGWRGDRYRLSARGELQLDLVWDIRLDSAESAAAMLPAALAMAGAQSMADEDPAPDAVSTSPEGRRLRITRPAPDIIRYENLAPE